MTSSKNLFIRRLSSLKSQINTLYCMFKKLSGIDKNLILH